MSGDPTVDLLNRVTNGTLTEDLLKIFLENGADINTPDRHGFTALHIALMNNNADPVIASKTAHLLLDHGARADIVPRTGSKPLLCAAAFADVALLERLINQAGVDINAMDKTGMPPLHSAIINRNFEAAHFLLDLGARADSQTFNDKTPLSTAQEFKRVPAAADIAKKIQDQIDANPGRVPLTAPPIEKTGGRSKTALVVGAGAGAGSAGEPGAISRHSSP